MKALLVDDERLARSGLRRLLESHDDVTVVGEAANADEALTQIRRLDPDVVFLDVEMPGRSGLELLEGLDELPAVIFTTAYQEYAVRAFEVSALDYLVKPIAGLKPFPTLLPYAAPGMMMIAVSSNQGGTPSDNFDSSELPTPLSEKMTGDRGEIRSPLGAAASSWAGNSCAETNLPWPHGAYLGALSSQSPCARQRLARFRQIRWHS